MKFLSDILVKAGLTVENTFSANAAANTIYAGTGTRLRTEANNLVFERVSSSGTMKMVFAQGTLSPTAKSYIGYSNATLNLILANEFATAGLELRTSDIIRQQIFSNGNTVIGQASPVDAGYKLDVFGTVRISSTTTLTSLAGTGDRMVVANSSGVLSTQAIVNPSAVLPVGGTTGQILAKIDNTNYNTEWIDNYTGTVKHTVKAGVSLTKGQAVYVSSADGTNMIVSKASNASEATSSKTMGLIAQSLSTNGTGFVVTEGLISGLDTSSAQAGDPVWLGTDGNLLFGLSNKPYAPNHLVYIGVVTRAQQNNGEIFVNVQNGFELNEIHNVQITSTPSDNTVLAYESSTSLYKMKSIATLLGYTPYDSSNPAGYISGITSNMVTTALGFTPVTNARTLTINGTTYDLSADRSWSVGTHTGSLTSGYIPKATGTTSLTDGLLYDTGSAILLGTQTAGSGKFMVYSTTADNHYQAVGSAPSFRFADAITNPTYTGIIGMATASNNFIIGAVAGDMVLSNNTNSAGNFLFGTGATERMRINATTGNISINNTNNTYKLDVTGTVRFTGQLRLESTITNGTYTYTLPSATGTLALTSQLTNGTVTSVGLSSATSGVTIGSTPITTSGTITLAIATASGSQQGLLSSTDWNTFNNKQNALTNPVTGTGTTNYLPKFTGTSTIGNSAVSDDGSTVTLNSRALSVSGGSTLTGRVTSVEIGVTKNGADTIGDGPWFRWTNAAQDRQMLTQLNASNGLTTWAFNGTSWSSLLTLNQTGNLGLGVTPSAWRNLFTAFQVGYTGALYAIATSTASEQVNLASNYYQDSAGNELRIQAGYATRYQQASGEHRWSTAGTSTAGSGISFTQAMTLNASGFLGIGTTSPEQLLDVKNSGGGTSYVLIQGQGRKMYLGQDGTGATIYSDGAVPMWFSTNGTEKMRLNASGNLSIGNTNDTYKLDVSGQINTNTFYRLMSGSTLVGAIGYTTSIFGSGGNNWVFYNSQATDNIFYTNGTERFRIASTGAATFSSSVTANSLVIRNSGVPAAQFYRDLDVTVVGAAGQGIEFGARSGSTFIAGAAIYGVLDNPATTGSIVLQTLTAGSLTTKLTIASTGAATFSGGATFGSDVFTYNNGGIFFSGGGSYTSGIFQNAGGLNLQTGGSPKLTITNAGSVGIGTTSPQGKLDITGSTSGDLLYLDAGVNTDFAYKVVTGADDALVLRRQHITQGDLGIMSWTYSGKVGIGTTSPSEKLELSGTGNVYARITATDASNAGVRFNSSGAREYGIFSDGALRFYDFTAATERMRITSGGFVGIGTTSPATQLHVVGSETLTSSGGIFIEGFYSSGGFTKIGSKYQTTNNCRAEVRFINPSTGADSDMSFAVSDGGNNLYNAMYIRGVGGVGIGTTNINVFRLNVAGHYAAETGSYATDGSGDSYRAGIGWQSTANPAAVLSTLITTINDGNYGGHMIFLNRGNNGGNLNERMRITSGGRLLLGLTSDFGYLLSVNGTSYFQGTALFNNTVTAGQYIQYQANDAYMFRTSNGWGGWARNAFSIQNESGTTLASFGGYGGSGTSLAYSYIGTAYNDYVVAFNSNKSVNFASSVTVGGLLIANDRLYIPGNRPISDWFSSSLTAGYSVSNSYGWVNGAGSLVLGTDGSERMRITNSGDVLVNATATTQGAKFYVNGLGAFGSVYVGSLGTGTVYSNGGTLTNTNPSDYRLKNTIKPLTYGLNEVLQLNPKTFYYNDDVTKARLKYGFIAQEVKDVMPDLVRKLGADTDYLGLENEGIFVTLVNAIKEQNNQIKEQQAQINELKSQLNK